MGFWTILQYYLVVSVALAATSYFTIYRPAIALTEEILDQELNMHRGWLGTFIWMALATFFSPIALFVLLKNNNTEFIDRFAVKLADDLSEEDE